MRHLALPLLLSAALGGCAGFSIGVRQDTEDGVALTKVLQRQGPGARLEARKLLPRPFTRLWVFRDVRSTAVIEQRLGIPFPDSSGEDVPVPYLVFDDGRTVVSAFTLDPKGPSTTLQAEREPIGPGEALRLIAGPRGGLQLTGAG